ncbi:MAG: hypothetical protein ABWY08_03195 [Comamonas sp.]
MASRDHNEHCRNPSCGREHDSDYQQWRGEQMRNLDAHYEGWRVMPDVMMTPCTLRRQAVLRRGETRVQKASSLDQAKDALKAWPPKPYAIFD